MALIGEFVHSAVVNGCRELLQQARELIKQHKNLPHFCHSEQDFLAFAQGQLQR